MVDATPLPANSLADLATRIKASHAGVLEASKGVVQKAIAVGTDLIAAKNQMKHGMWLPYLRDNCGVSERHATRYMQLAAGKHKLAQLKPDIMSDLTLTGALRFIQGKTKENDGSGDLGKYDKAQATLIKKLKKLSPDEVEAAAQQTIEELEKVVAAIKPTAVKAA
jgi:Protein of unknown function (DUF3102)